MKRIFCLIRKPDYSTYMRKIKLLQAARQQFSNLDHHTLNGLILAGRVLVGTTKVDKPGQWIPLDAPLRILGQTRQFVGRGGEKLHRFLVDHRLENAFKGKSILDLGAATGGFTDCALQLGAHHVTTVDIGYNLLDWKIRTNPRVSVYEKSDIFRFDWNRIQNIDWVIGDVSWAPFQQIMEVLTAINQLQNTRDFLILIKPQFETPIHQRPMGGVIIDEQRTEVLKSVHQSILESHFHVIQWADSKLKGRKGNQERFYHLRIEESAKI